MAAILRVDGYCTGNQRKDAPVPNTPTDKGELVRELEHYVHELDVVDHLNSYRTLLDLVPQPAFKKFPYFLLELSPKEGRLHVTPYTARDDENASLAYIRAERADR